MCNFFNLQRQMRIKSLILGLLSGLSLLAVSCDKKPDLFYPEAKDFCGQWKCTVETTGDPEDVWAEDLGVYTYNTAANDATIWVSDEGLIFNQYIDIVKANVDINALSFQSAGEATEDAGVIKKGGIFKNAVKVKPQYLDGDAISADSIDFTVEFFYKDTKFSVHYFGHRETGWEDYVQ